MLFRDRGLNTHDYNIMLHLTPHRIIIKYTATSVHIRT